MHKSKEIECAVLVGKNLDLYGGLGKSERSLQYLEEEEQEDTKDSQVTPELVIDSLSSYKVRSKGVYSMCHFSCDICHYAFRIGDHVTSLPCQHKFHNYCIENWLKWVKPTCPVDKKPVSREKHPTEIGEDRDKGDNDFESQEEEEFGNFTSLTIQRLHLNGKSNDDHQYYIDESEVSLKKREDACSFKTKAYSPDTEVRNSSPKSQESTRKSISEKKSCSSDHERGDADSVKNKDEDNSNRHDWTVITPKPFKVNDKDSSSNVGLNSPAERDSSQPSKVKKKRDVKKPPMVHGVKICPLIDGRNPTEYRSQEFKKNVEDLRQKLLDDSKLRNRRNYYDDYFKGPYHQQSVGDSQKHVTYDWNKSKNTAATALDERQRMTLQDIVASKTKTFADMMPRLKKTGTEWAYKHHMKIPHAKISTLY